MKNDLNTSWNFILVMLAEILKKKSKIFGIKNFELDMLDTVFRPQEHDALG